MFTGSAPPMTAQLMPEHKHVDHKRIDVTVAPHALDMLDRGFDTMTAPPLKIAARRIQRSRQISQTLDELAPRPPLLCGRPAAPAGGQASEAPKRECSKISCGASSCFSGAWMARRQRGLLNLDNFRRRWRAPANETSGTAKPARIYDLRSTVASNF